jgi:hypothetical protein
MERILKVIIPEIFLDGGDVDGLFYDILISQKGNSETTVADQKNKDKPNE